MAGTSLTMFVEVRMSGYEALCGFKSPKEDGDVIAFALGRGG
jgi:hypothetical protein